MRDNATKLKDLENSLFAIVNSIVDSDFNSNKDSADKELRKQELRVRELKKKDFSDKFSLFKQELKSSRKASKKEKFDIAIFTIVPVEFEYANKQLNFMGKGDTADFEINGLDYHKFELDRTHLNKSKLTCAITLVGEAGDVNCALTCTQFFNKYDCDLAILCGIAAGVKGEISIYSPIIGTDIINYEFQRLEENGITYRPLPFSLEQPYTNHITGIIKNKENLNELIKNNIKAFNNSNPKLPAKDISKIDVKKGVIGSGAKLIANRKKIQTLRKNIPIKKGISAFEMEGSGFVPACKSYNKNWMVFRGISDYGENDKDNPNNKLFQKFAVISAVTTMKYYLENYFSNADIEVDKDLDF